MAATVFTALPILASPLGLTLNPTGSNGAAHVTPDTSNTGGTFATAGGTGWANLGVTLSSASGPASFDAWGSVDIDSFTNPVFAAGQPCGTKCQTGVAVDGGDWTFFATLHVAGSGSWASGGPNDTVFTPGPSPGSVTKFELDLWAAHGGIADNNFGGAQVGTAPTSLSDFTSLGFQASGQKGAVPTCYTSSGNAGGTATTANCLLVATAATALSGTSFAIDENATESKDTITFSLGTEFFAALAYAIGANDFFFPQPPDPASFGLVVISGCREGTVQPINIGDKDSATFFETASNQSGNAACSGNGQANNHDPVNWAFVGSNTAVPEPGSLALLGSGLATLGLIGRRRRHPLD